MLHLHHLPNSKPGEKPVLFLRRHWLAVARLFFFVALASVAPLLITWLLGQTMPSLLHSSEGGAIGSVFLSIYYLSVITFLFQEFIDYYLDVWIVTTERIINIEQHGLFNRVASEMHIALVQDVTAEVQGATATFLDYGQVYIQTAGEDKRFLFKNVPHPEQIRNTILRLAEEDRFREESVGHTL
ncbi:hypothetical protein COV06_03375 [Candidatus Uhrbacteria bacterium CG10_big_fil_rev_8_21_14_0_10_50_16]|uniref:YdbS-like PH domain-containing protein n=1 Tax=Candidatus Uhrbacteria bacterium CG10_big_fil_rev_8_21_14_0_10_50_16 TaxID=1975039 RepID=A0A2H0RLQ0_9BACT|nr:MAG: hypothetical protein COV06_03375 [Candidatus Uhrbacteria bacterium CG10_big_fil_rev_8_21_14_0_10_50_16]